MRILVVGGGGREHSLCWAISASPLCTKLYCAPGNAGIAQVAECIDVAAEDIAGQVALAKREKIDFVVVGPEVPLAMGLADRIAEAGIKVFGPSQKAAQLESSKGFTKELCKRHNIPTGAYERFTDADKAAAYIKAQGAPIVVKADGLAAGKGVVVAETVEQAIEAARAFRPMGAGEVEALLAKTREAARDGAFELFKTSSIFDSTAQHPEWLGEEPDRVKQTVQA
jgi:phosphoribosylamine--glycine ligase